MAIDATLDDVWTKSEQKKLVQCGYKPGVGVDQFPFAFADKKLPTGQKVEIWRFVNGVVDAGYRIFIYFPSRNPICIGQFVLLNDAIKIAESIKPENSRAMVKRYSQTKS